MKTVVPVNIFVPLIKMSLTKLKTSQKSKMFLEGDERFLENQSTLMSALVEKVYECNNGGAIK